MPRGTGNDAPCACTPATAVSRSEAGSAADFTAASVRDTVRLANTEPMTATPSAAPTWRTVELVPLATPDFSGGMSERITLVSCELVKPMPNPNRP